MNETINAIDRRRDDHDKHGTSFSDAGGCQRGAGLTR